MEKCRECGMIHPYAPPGKCPVKKAMDMSVSDKGKAIVSLTSKLSEYLEKSDNWEEEINKINKLLGI